MVIRTQDLGHAGSYGFAYPDDPLEAKPWTKEWMMLEVPGPLWIVQPTGRIDKHWWRVLYNLD